MDDTVTPPILVAAGPREAERRVLAWVEERRGRSAEELWPPFRVVVPSRSLARHPFAVLASSLRYTTNDHLWFSFFHELGHLVRHGKKLRFIEGSGLDGLGTEKEREADAFASTALIPDPRVLREFVRGSVSEAQMRSVAARLGIALGDPRGPPAA